MNFFQNLMPYPAKELLNVISLNEACPQLFKDFDLVALEAELKKKEKITVENVQLDCEKLNEKLLKGVNINLAQGSIQKVYFHFPKNYVNEKIYLDYCGVNLTFELCDQKPDIKLPPKKPPVKDFLEGAKNTVANNIEFKIQDLQINFKFRSSTISLFLTELSFTAFEKNNQKNVFLINKKLELFNLILHVGSKSDMNNKLSLEEKRTNPNSIFSISSTSKQPDTPEEESVQQKQLDIIISFVQNSKDPSFLKATVHCNLVELIISEHVLATLEDIMYREIKLSNVETSAKEVEKQDIVNKEGLNLLGHKFKGIIFDTKIDDVYCIYLKSSKDISFPRVWLRYLKLEKEDTKNQAKLPSEINHDLISKHFNYLDENFISLFCSKFRLSAKLSFVNLPSSLELVESDSIELRYSEKSVLPKNLEEGAWSYDYQFTSKNLSHTMNILISESIKSNYSNIVLFSLSDLKSSGEAFSLSVVIKNVTCIIFLPILLKTMLHLDKLIKVASSIQRKDTDNLSETFKVEYEIKNIDVIIYPNDYMYDIYGNIEEGKTYLNKSIDLLDKITQEKLIFNLNLRGERLYQSSKFDEFSFDIDNISSNLYLSTFDVMNVFQVKNSPLTNTQTFHKESSNDEFPMVKFSRSKLNLLDQDDKINDLYGFLKSSKYNRYLKHFLSADNSQNVKEAQITSMSISSSLINIQFGMGSLNQFIRTLNKLSKEFNIFNANLEFLDNDGKSEKSVANWWYINLNVKKINMFSYWIVPGWNRVEDGLIVRKQLINWNLSILNSKRESFVKSTLKSINLQFRKKIISEFESLQGDENDNYHQEGSQYIYLFYTLSGTQKVVDIALHYSSTSKGHKESPITEENKLDIHVDSNNLVLVPLFDNFIRYFNYYREIFKQIQPDLFYKEDVINIGNIDEDNRQSKESQVSILQLNIDCTNLFLENYGQNIKLDNSREASLKQKMRMMYNFRDLSFKFKCINNAIKFTMMTSLEIHLLLNLDFPNGLLSLINCSVEEIANKPYQNPDSLQSKLGYVSVLQIDDFFFSFNNSTHLIIDLNVEQLNITIAKDSFNCVINHMKNVQIILDSLNNTKKEADSYENYDNVPTLDKVNGIENEDLPNIQVADVKKQSKEDLIMALISTKNEPRKKLKKRVTVSDSKSSSSKNYQELTLNSSNLEEEIKDHATKSKGKVLRDVLHRMTVNTNINYVQLSLLRDYDFLFEDDLKYNKTRGHRTKSNRSIRNYIRFTANNLDFQISTLKNINTTKLISLDIHKIQISEDDSDMKMKDTIIVDQYYIQPLSDEISQVLNIKIDINDQNNILAYITLEPLNVLLRKRTISHIVDFFDLEIENSALKCTNLGVQYEENNLLNLINSTFKIKKLVMGKTFLNVSLENDQSVIQNSNFEILNKSVNFKDLKIVWNKLKMRDTTILEAFGRMKFQLEYILENDLADKFLKSISVVRPIRQILRAFTQLVVKPFDTSQERIKKKDREQIMRTQESHKLEIFAENLRCTFAKVALEGYSILESLKFG